MKKNSYIVTNHRRGQWIGEYLWHHQCRFCFKENLKEIIDFGNVPLAGGFIPKGSGEKEFNRERLYPLKIQFCPDCYLVQVNTIVPTEVLYKDYFYFSSSIGTLVNHFKAYAEELASIYSDRKKRLVVEIGCNDGVFLKPLAKLGFKVAGVDPAANVVKPLLKEGLNIIIDGFNPQTAHKIMKRQGQADVIVSSNSFAHIDNMHEVMKGITTLLKPDGQLIFEVHYFGILMAELQYDMMYHDHMSYYTLIALQNFLAQFEMEIFDLRPIPIHAGSRRFYVQYHKTGGRKIEKRVRDLRKLEIKNGLDQVETYRTFYRSIDKTRKDLMRLLNKLKKQGKTIVGYGASGRGTQLMSFCGITQEQLSCVLDDAPNKQGAFTPGNHLPITSSQIMHDPDKRPDFALLFAWSFAEEVKKRNLDYLENGGAFIVPLPEVKIIRG